MDDDPRVGPGEWLRAALLIVVLVGLLTLGFAFVITNGFAPCCTQPAPGFTQSLPP